MIVCVRELVYMGLAVVREGTRTAGEDDRAWELGPEAPEGARETAR